jgi:hypothetical protein
MTHDSSGPTVGPLRPTDRTTMDDLLGDFPTTNPVLGFVARYASPGILGSAHAIDEGVQR